MNVLKIIIALFLLAFTVHFSLAGWWNESFPYRQNITIDSVSPNDLYNFSAFLNVSKHNQMQSDYDDLRFFNATCGVNGVLLDYEIDTRTSSNVLLWMRVANLTNGNNSFCMYYGNSSVTTGESLSGSWNSEYVSVLHMNETSGIIVSDSSSRNTNFYNNLASLDVSGRVGSGSSFDSDNNPRMNLSNGLFLNNSYALELWAYWQTNTSNIHTLLSEKSAFKYLLRRHPNNDGRLYLGGLQIAILGWTPPMNEWVHYGISVNKSGSTSVFQNGIKLSTSAITPELYNLMYIGNSEGNDESFNGSLDEIRVLNSSRSDGWLNMSYHTVASPSLVVYGSEDQLNTAPVFTDVFLRDYSGLLWNASTNISGIRNHNVSFNVSGIIDADGDNISIDVIVSNSSGYILLNVTDRLVVGESFLSDSFLLLQLGNLSINLSVNDSSSSTVSTAWYNVSNRPPLMSVSSIDYSSLEVSADLRGYCNASDLDNPQIFYFYKWNFLDVNNVNDGYNVLSSGRSENHNESSALNVANNTQSSTGNYSFSCVASDGIHNSTELNSSIVTIVSTTDRTTGSGIGTTIKMNEDVVLNLSMNETLGEITDKVSLLGLKNFVQENEPLLIVLVLMSFGGVLLWNLFRD